MKAVNDYIVIEKIKEQKTTSGGLLLTDDTDTDNRYKKAKIISVGNIVEDWILKGAYCQNANFGSMDWAPNDPVSITMNIVMDYAILNF